MINIRLEQRWKRKLKGNKNELVRKLYDNWTYLNAIPDGENNIVARYNTPEDYFGRLLYPHISKGDPTAGKIVKLLNDLTFGNTLYYHGIKDDIWIKNKFKEIYRKIINRTLTQKEFELFSSEKDLLDKHWDIDWIKTQKIKEELYKEFRTEKDGPRNYELPKFSL